MKTQNVIFVRIYITEGSNKLKTIVNYLTKEASIRGVSVFRALSGYGESGAHTSSLLDLSLDLPLAIEFFDVKEKVDVALDHLTEMVKPEHIIFWEADANA